MRVLLTALGVLGMALLFGLCERAPAAAETVSSLDVQLLSEQSLDDPYGFGKNGNGGRNGISGGGRGRLGGRAY